MVVLVVLSSMVVQLIYNNRLDNEVHRLALSYDLALKAESLDTQILTVVSSLRGYELTGTEANLTALEAAKKRAFELNDEMIAVWSRMGASRKDQLERAEKIKVLFNVLLKEVVEPCIIERKLVNEGKHDMNQMSEFVSKYSAGPRVAAINAVMVELLNKSAENVQIIRNNYTSMQQTAAWVAQSAAVTVLVLSLLIAIWTANHIARRLAMAGEVVEATARGDLTVRINAEGRDEIARLLDSVIRMQNQLSTVFRGFIENAEQISGQSNQLASTAEQLSSASAAQSEASSGMAAAMEELTVSIAHVTTTAEQSADHARNSGQAAAQGRAVLEKVTHSIEQIARHINQMADDMEKLEKQSTEISMIVQVIEELAGQTNLLALNAAIEAARAGEQGRGFAVVADEVRKLAERTATSTQEITAMISLIQGGTREAVAAMHTSVGQVEEGVTLVNEASGLITRLAEGATAVGDQAKDISSALQEQKMASNEISGSVENIARMAEDNTGRVHDVVGVANSLRSMATHLRQEVSHFKLG